MNIFAPFASDTSLLLGLTYPPAASAANKQCGTGYAPGPESVVASPTPPVPLSTSTAGSHNSVNGGGVSSLSMALGMQSLAAVVMAVLCLGGGMMIVL